jgi:hypothetical protein
MQDDQKIPEKNCSQDQKSAIILQIGKKTTDANAVAVSEQLLKKY